MKCLAAPQLKTYEALNIVDFYPVPHYKDEGNPRLLVPQSDYEYDSARDEFEYYDQRDHGDKLQMDICVPVRKRGR